MRSGAGRHRRPKQAPAFLVAAGVVGAGIALPLLATGSARAVSEETWDRAAECESGGVWTLNSGNGYYGGFQLSLDLWQRYGGQEFAARPDLASRAQQISVAERMLADQGQDALPGCALLSGLWAEFRSEDMPDGVSGSREAPRALGQLGELLSPEEPEEPGERQEPREVPEASRWPSEETAEPSPGPAAGTGQSSEDPPQEPSAGAAGGSSAGEGRHRGEMDPAEAAGGSPSGGGRHAAGAGDAELAERGEEPAESLDREHWEHREDREDRTPDERAAEVFEVRGGDPLSGMAGAQELRGGWTGLYGTE